MHSLLLLTCLFGATSLPVVTTRRQLTPYDAYAYASYYDKGLDKYDGLMVRTVASADLVQGEPNDETPVVLNESYFVVPCHIMLLYASQARESLSVVSMIAMCLLLLLLFTCTRPSPPPPPSVITVDGALVGATKV